MREPHERLQLARRKRGYASPTDAARAYGWNINTYRSHENGNAPLSRKAAERYGASLRVSVGWLLTGENPPDWDSESESVPERLPVRRVPILTMQQAFSLTQGEELEHILNIRDYAVIGVDPMLGPDVFALEIEDEAMEPEFHRGEFIAVDPTAAIRPGDYVAAAIKARETTVIRRYRIKGYGTDGEELVELEALNKAWPDIPLSKDTGAIIGKVVWQMRRF